MQSPLRQHLIDICLRMNASGINQGTSGNVSARVGDGYLITPSGMPYESLKSSDIVRMDLSGNPQGVRKPSSEWRFHSAVYERRSDAKAIVHVHPTYATALACLRREIPSFHYMVAVAGGHSIRCSEYATFGTEALAEAVLAALKDRKACLMGNHGILCLESSLDKALALAIEVEQLAHQYWAALQVGEPEILGREEMDRVIEKFKTYGSNAQES